MKIPQPEFQVGQYVRVRGRSQVMRVAASYYCELQQLYELVETPDFWVKEQRLEPAKPPGEG